MHSYVPGNPSNIFQPSVQRHRPQGSVPQVLTQALGRLSANRLLDDLAVDQSALPPLAFADQQKRAVDGAHRQAAEHRKRVSYLEPTEKEGEHWRIIDNMRCHGQRLGYVML
jgi:hypothetical protein